jgi:hypothetical protein
MVRRARDIRSVLRFIAAGSMVAFGGLAAAGCSSDEICERSCDAWAGCWDTDECWSDCKNEGDWSSEYAACCEDNAGDCAALEIICG